VRGGVGVGWDGLRGSCGLEVFGCGAGEARLLKLLRGGFKFCGCGAGADTKFNPRRTLQRTCLVFIEYFLPELRSYILAFWTYCVRY